MNRQQLPLLFFILDSPKNPRNLCLFLFFFFFFFFFSNRRAPTKVSALSKFFLVVSEKMSIVAQLECCLGNVLEICF
ncbi:hypothetical protein MRB53_000026 [Persea americana]|uniref:Uncharacterized protein n=1 Tax=Persea americana TaxID=3435 RepID=A0ACC2MN06_PERAE|nr:hypothetical protein MRB53_000026 [Persea americana]